MAFSEKLYTLRRSRGLSQEQLAEQLNVSRQAVSKWESGQSMPDGEKLLAISDCFGVSLDELMRDAPSPAGSTQTADVPPPVTEAQRTPRPVGMILCICGILGMILWGILSVFVPAAGERIGGSSAIQIDGNGIFLLLCVLALVSGAVLLLKNASKK